MDHHAAFGQALGIAGALSPLYEDVVAAAALGGDAQAAEGIGHDSVGVVHLPRRADDGVVEVAEVVVHGAASRHATGEHDAVGFQEGEVDLCVRALIQADDHGGSVLPEEENGFVQAEPFEREFVEGHVPVGVCGGVQ